MRIIIKSIFVVLLTLFIGCEDDDDIRMREYIQQEERYFQLYLDANYPDISPLSNGLFYINNIEGTGSSPDTGDYVLINYVAYTIPDEKVVDTYIEEWARDHNLYSSSVLYGPYKYKHGSEIEGLREGISMMKEGGIARLLFKSDLGYGKTGSGMMIDPYESLMYDVELIEVIEDPAEREITQIKAYLAEHPGYTKIYDNETESEMYFYHTEPGDSVFVKNSSTVEVFYTGQLLDGRVFDSNEGSASGIEVIIGEEEVIRGWEIALPYFRYGSKGRLLIPHPLAYGETGSTAANSDKTSIPPFEALLFDIEVTKRVIEKD